ncbi:MAG: hypothetical protein ACR2PL_12510 [Dehalococcoidia bacterium]
MQAVLLRVGIDSGSGGIQGPLFGDGSFELIPVPDIHDIDERTYGNTPGRYGRALIDYFPLRLHARLRNQSMHVDPEFETYTYGDPGPTKAGLTRLEKGDMLIFYCGLQGYDRKFEPALYIAGYFEIEHVAKAGTLSADELSEFSNNAHVCQKAILQKQRDKLLLIRGTKNSRLLSRARCISGMGSDRDGKPLKVLSEEMLTMFGPLGGRNSLQRSNPRWITAPFVEGAAGFVRTLP